MTKTQVMALLKKNKNERGIKHWRTLDNTKLGGKKLKSFGIGLSQLRKLARQVGRDHKLAQALWNSDVYDAKVLGLLIDEPKKMTRKQAEEQVKQAGIGMFAHVLCTCGATLPRAPFARELAVEWMKSKDDNRRRCGYLLLYELGKDTRDKALDNAFFKGHLDRIARTIGKEKNWVKEAMNGSLLSIGKRNVTLNKAAIKTAKSYWPIEVDYGDNSCETLDIVKHLTSDYMKKRLQA